MELRRGNNKSSTLERDLYESNHNGIEIATIFLAFAKLSGMNRTIPPKADKNGIEIERQNIFSY